VDPRTDLIAVREGGPDFNVDDVACSPHWPPWWAGPAGRNGLQQLLQGFRGPTGASLDRPRCFTASAETART